MITDHDIALAIGVAQGETECVESRALKILHEMCGAIEVHRSDAERRLREMLEDLEPTT